MQTFFAKQLASHFSKKLNAKVEIQALDVDFLRFNSFQLEQFYMEDQDGDTLTYVEELQISLGDLSLDNRSMFLEIVLNKAIIKLKRGKEEEQFNHEFILEFFSNSGVQSSSWDYNVDQLQLLNSSFSLHDHHYPDTAESIDYNHLDIAAVNLNAKNLVYKGDTINALLEKLSLQSDKGFSIKSMEAKLTVSTELIALQNLALQTDLSDLNGNISFVANSFDDYNDFAHKVYLSIDLQSALVQLKELAFFAPGLIGINQEVFLDGSIRGTIDNLSAENMEIHLNKNTYLYGDLDVRGLPEIENAFIHLDLKELELTADGIRQIPLPPFEKNDKLSVSKHIDALGKIFFNGKFTGFYNDFVAYGNLSTAQGNAKLDLKLQEGKSGAYAFKGQISSNGFHIGNLFEIEGLERVSLDVDIEGNDLSSNHVDAKINGKIDSLIYKEYSYHNLSLNGKFFKETFKGNISMKDKNLALEFKGKVDYSKNNPSSDFEMKVDRAMLARLNLFNQKDPLTSLGFKAKLTTYGNDIDQLRGQLQLENIEYKDSDQDSKISDFFAESKFIGERREFSIQSSLLNAKLEGKFKFNELVDDLISDLKDALVSNVHSSSGELSFIQDFDFFIDIKDIKPLTEVILPQLILDSSLLLNGNYNELEKQLNIELAAKRLSYGKSDLENLKLEFNLQGDSSRLRIYSHKLNSPARLSLDSFYVQTVLNDADLETNVGWKGLNGNGNKGVFNVSNHFDRIDKTQLSFTDSYFNVNDTLWTISNANKIEIDSTTLRFHAFRMLSMGQFFDINGTISENPEDTLKLDIENMDLNLLNLLLPEGDIELAGIAKGGIILARAYDNPFILSDLYFSNFSLNGIDFNSAYIKSKWKATEEAIQLNSRIGEGSVHGFKIDGLIYPKAEDRNYQLSANFVDFPIDFFSPFIEGTLSQLEGTIKGGIYIDGAFSRPILNGELLLQESKFKVDYLNTSYSINDNIWIRPDFIGFDFIEIRDENNNKAISTGTVFHDNYSDFNLDIYMEFENFLSLNTNSTDNELFYGKAVTSGNANISGYANQLDFNLNLKAGRGTDFKIPLGSEVEVTGADFITFTNSDASSIAEEKEVDLEGIQMNFNLDIRPEAKVQIIFDEQLGDIIKAEGEGKLKLEINTLGDFNIYGEYQVQKGSYLFTLQNIINKRFKIVNGSRISWDGDPLRARLDMKAIYATRAPLYDLFPADTNSNFRRRIPVDLELRMTGFMLQPDINFNINLPTVDDNIRTRLNSLLYVNNNEVNKQEMNQQVFGLLVLNRFVPTSATSGSNYNAGREGINNGYEVLSNQLSNWLSKMSDQFDVGLNYRPSNEVSNEEIDLTVSTELLNNRLVLDGNFGYSDNGIQTDADRTSNFIGEFTVEYKLNEEGKFRLKAFNRSTNNSLLQVNSPYTQGVGVFYREEFETFDQLWRKYFNRGSSK